MQRQDEQRNGHDIMMSDSDDDIALPSEFVDDDLQRALEESRATFAHEQRERKRSSPPGNFQAASDDDDSELDGELEILAPKPVVKKEKEVYRADAHRPTLSSSGEKPSDPVNLDLDSSDDDDLNMGIPLRERIMQKRVPYKSPAVKEFVSKTETNKEGDDDRKPPPRSNKDSTGTRKPELPSRRDLYLSSSSDDELYLKPLKEKGAILKSTSPPGKSTFSNLAMNDSSSDDSLAATVGKKLSAPTSSHLLLSEDSSSDDDSDDSDLFPSQRSATKKKKGSARGLKDQERQRKARERERKKMERQAKQAQKEQDKLARQKEREDKKAAQKAEKEARKRRREAAAQAGGKNAKNEIAVLMERGMYQGDVLGLRSDLQKHEYTVVGYPSGLGCNTLQFIRKDGIAGGAEDAVKMLHSGKTAGYEHIPVLAIIIDDPGGFIRLLDRPNHEEDDDYPLLNSWLVGIESGWKAAWKVSPDQCPRILLFLNNVMNALDKAWVAHRRKGRGAGKAPPTAEELHDAITWILIEFNVECVRCSSEEDMATHVRKMTRYLSEKPYQKEVTDLECVKKVKATCNELHPVAERSTDCWRRQLQQIPNVSEKMSSNIVQYYPTARSLWIKYQDPSLSESDKRLLLAGCCGSRRQPKISSTIYDLLTSEDPNQMV